MTALLFLVSPAVAFSESHSFFSASMAAYIFRRAPMDGISSFSNMSAPYIPKQNTFYSKRTHSIIEKQTLSPSLPPTCLPPIYPNTHTYTQTHTRIPKHTHVYAYSWVRVRVRQCICACACVCERIFARAHTRTHTRTNLVAQRLEKEVEHIL